MKGKDEKWKGRDKRGIREGKGNGGLLNP